MSPGLYFSPLSRRGWLALSRAGVVALVAGLVPCPGSTRPGVIARSPRGRVPLSCCSRLCARCGGRPLVLCLSGGGCCPRLAWGRCLLAPLMHSARTWFGLSENFLKNIFLTMPCPGLKNSVGGLWCALVALWA